MSLRSIHSSSRRLAGLTATAALGSLVLAACEPPPVITVQRGYRGTAMVEVYHPATLEAEVANNQPPPITPTASPDGPKAGAIYQNVKVLGDLSVGQFAGLMVDMTNWVAPAQGCSYCHVSANFAEDTLYTKVVARRMLQMTQHINADWKLHVQNTGVTCYTCHRGNNVPTNIWYQSTDAVARPGMLGNKMGQNSPAPQIGYASLPNDVFSKYLEGAEPIRVNATSALPEGPGAPIANAESTYGLMMHMSKSLGVNCTYCHNTRAFASWEQSTPQRAVAYYGIRMARDLNNEYLDSLNGVFPSFRLGPLGDVPKLNCATCHQGAFKPLYGANILHGYPGLVGPATAPATSIDKIVMPGSPGSYSTSAAETGVTTALNQAQP
jgi:photosynthetic reaction center cytochrome c subunit